MMLRILNIKRMTINIVCTSKPVDGLFFYSYEYCALLNDLGIPATLVIICHRHFNPQNYIDAITSKYIHCRNIVFDTYVPEVDDVTLVMGRSMVTISWLNFKDYTPVQQACLHGLFSNKVISVYSENHVVDYPKALAFYSPKQIVDLCDTEVYPNGVGEHFEKMINFSIYLPYENNIQFKHLFLGTNDKYYMAAENALHLFPDYGIVTYHAKYINPSNNNIFAPVENLLGIFDTYVYTKETFDPAPRIIQECKFFGKNMVYHRDKSIVDGGSVYWNRPIKYPNINPILNALERFK
jgi:hypothetical protein